MKKSIKKSFIIILFLILTINVFCSLLTPSVFATTDNFNFGAFENDATPDGVKNAVNDSAGTVIAVLRIVCVTIAIVMLLTIAMKYMISSAGDRADIKKHAVNYVIGAFILFGVTGILGIINNFVVGTLSSSSGTPAQ